ncbi:hypothetical protein K440DRAFT_540369 [Wilcoxina mikolae CBS 423.85]|nr:hypothetical protein K440DRAFT_540369 [Wilcoxina mikolae CBS 423.85]
MRNPPPSVVSTWPHPNYIDPDSQGASLHVVGITLIVLSAVTVGLRIFVRTRILHTAGIDDWLILVSIVPAIGMTTSALMGIWYGWGKHIWDSRMEWYKPSLIVSWVCQMLFVVAVTFIKLSICYSYRRLSQHGRFHMIINLTRLAILCWGVVFTLTVIFRCWPPEAYWGTQSLRPKECMNETVLLLCFTMTNLITDIWLVVVPVPTLYKLQLPFKQRLILMILMSLGLVACVASLVRGYYLYKTLVTTYDVTWEGYNIWLWTAVEVHLFIITSSVPTLRPLVHRYFPLLIDTHKRLSGG